MFHPKSHLPQYGYFRASYKIPGTDWTLTGHSRALERTGFWIPQLHVMLDAGVDLPTNSGAQPKAILITHGHIDHCNALPMLLRHSSDAEPTQIFAPYQIVHRLRLFAQLSWAVKVDMNAPLPEPYQPPPDTEQLPEPGSVLIGDLPFRLWRPCDHNNTTATTLALGKKGKTPLVVHCLQLFHKQCSTVGYMLSTPAQEIKKVRPDLVGATKQETGQNVRAARQRGENHLIKVEIPEQPLLAFVLDTQIEALMENESTTAYKIVDCPVVIIECTYLEETMVEEARKRGHICWYELLPFIEKSVQRRQKGGLLQTWILVHFSLRYLDQQIVNFFQDEAQCRLVLEKRQSTEEQDEKRERPADVVLWLDEGPKELWVDSVSM